MRSFNCNVCLGPQKMRSFPCNVCLGSQAVRFEFLKINKKFVYPCYNTLSCQEK